MACQTAVERPVDKEKGGEDYLGNEMVSVVALALDQAPERSHGNADGYHRVVLAVVVRHEQVDWACASGSGKRGS